MAAALSTKTPVTRRPFQRLITSLDRVEQDLSRLEKLSRDELRGELASDQSGERSYAALLDRVHRLAHRAAQVGQLARAGRQEGMEEAARRNGRARILAMVRSGDLLEPARFAADLGWTRQALSKALAARRVFFLEFGSDRYYPAFFMDPRYERRHLETISKTLGDLPGTTKFLFLTTPKASLGGLTPLQALEQGNLSAVKTAAEGFAER